MVELHRLSKIGGIDLEVFLEFILMFRYVYKNNL